MAFAITLMPILVSAQISIDGTITGKNSGEPLPRAGISLTNTQLSTQSNSAGTFEFKNLKAGTYSIRVKYTGYKTLDSIINVDRHLTLNLKLEQATTLTDEVIVKATRATENSATTFRNISKEELEKNNLGQDLPYLLNQTPSVVITSDAGAGVGYTGIRIRGSDPTRINMTINGIPYNDSESQGTFLVNLPDFASSVNNIQIQRGVGTSTNGAGAFGASINVQTTTKRDSAYAELNNSFGSFDTWKNTVNVGTGLINQKFSFDGRLSRIKSNGYMDRASSNLKSYFLSGAYYGKKSLLRANVFSGSEKTYQAWNGVPESMLATNRTYNEFTYQDQTDNYIQDHYQLLYSHSFSDKLSANAALHYTYGRGYYEEYKNAAALADYGFQPVIIGGATIIKTDLIRRRWLDNDFYGATYSLNYTPQKNLDFTLGGAYNEYKGKHFGEVIWAQYASNSTNHQHYYDDSAFKTDFNIFGKGAWESGRTSLFADLQYRRVGYSFLGFDHNLNNIQQKDGLNFFNPKIGLSYQLNARNSIYASFAVANREPNRDDYTESSPIVPKSERLNDFELGLRSNHSNFSAGINGYYMLYKNQLVVTGQINDVGGYLRTNVPDSYRLGMELDGKWQISNQLNLGLTASLSQNRIKNFTEYIYSYDDDSQTPVSYKNKDIAFSPSFLSSGELTFIPFKNTEIALLSKYVGEQFLDNTANENRKINSFFTNDLRLQHAVSFKNRNNITVSLLVNNLFNELYESNGYTFSYVSGGSLSTENYYFPQATRNFLMSVSLKF
jgi:iron complex outermembrane receptor protein